MDEILQDIDRLIQTETVRSRHIVLVRLRQRLVEMFRGACDTE